MTKAKKRNVIVALALVALLAIGGTLAYLTATTNTKENTFTMGEGITGETEEPSWDSANGEKFTPGKVIAKDPQIENTSNAGTDPVYVAATLTYQVKNDKDEWVDTTYAELDQFINIKTGTGADQTDGFNTTNWTMAKDNTVAYYEGNQANKGKLGHGETTESIFDAVEIDKLALTPDQVESAKGSNIQFDVTKYNTTDNEGNVIGDYTTYTMKDFQIVVKGYLVQGSDDFTNVQNAMQTAFPNVFK